jgi:hypothetical protein
MRPSCLYNTANTGSRSLDIIHVASALALKANRFLTLDDRQSELASMVGLKVVTKGDNEGFAHRIGLSLK